MKRLITSLLFSGLAIFSFAQDIHFSQFYASPLSLNPGMTGLSLGDFRVIGNFRNQWASVTNPYITTSVSFDMKAHKFQNKDYVGAGVMIFNDGSNTSTYHNFRLMVSGAFHKALDMNGNHYLSLGVQGGFVQKGLGNNITLPNQWNETTGYDPNSGGETDLGNKIGYGDLQTGLMYYGFLSDNQSSVYGGMSIFHLAKPNESFVPNNTHRVHRRFVANGGLRYVTDDAKWIFNPSLIFMAQSSAREFNLGTSVNYKISPSADRSPYAIGGLWYRFGDAVILMGGVEIENWTAGLSYDINVSSLKEVSRGRGAFELSLRYNFNRPGSSQLGTNPCPRI